VCKLALRPGRETKEIEMLRCHRRLVPVAILAILGLAGCTKAAGPGGAAPTAPTAASRPAAPAFQGFVDLPGVHLYYTDSGGSGTPVIFGHAHTGNSDIYQGNIPAFVKAGYRVIAYDRRGSGRSTPNPATGPQPSTTAEDLQALVDYLKLDRFHLVGEAHGGEVAVDYALLHPEKVISLSIVSGGLMLSDPELALMKARWTSAQFNALPDQFKEISFDYMATNPDGLKKWLDINAHSLQPGVPEQPISAEITFAKLATLKQPFLFLAGDQDLTTPPYVVRMLAAHVPGSEFVLVPDAAHSISWEQPEVFDQDVIQFLGKH